MILIVLVGLSLMGATVENMNISIVMSYVKCDLKLTVHEQGVLSSISFLGTLLTSYFWGFLTDTWGRRKVLAVGALGGFIFSFPSGLVTNIYVLIVLRFLSGAM